MQGPVSASFFFDQGAAIPVRGSRSGYFAPHVFSVYRSPYTLILVDNVKYTCTGFHALYWEITGGHHFFLHLQENGG